MPAQLEVVAISAQQAGRYFPHPMNCATFDWLSLIRDGNAAKGPEYLVAAGAFVLLSAVAARMPNPRFHMLFVLSAVAYEISFSIRHFSTLD